MMKINKSDVRRMGLLALAGGILWSIEMMLPTSLRMSGFQWAMLATMASAFVIGPLIVRHFDGRLPSKGMPDDRNCK